MEHHLCVCAHTTRMHESVVFPETVPFHASSRHRLKLQATTHLPRVSEPLPSFTLPHSWIASACHDACAMPVNHHASLIGQCMLK